MTRIETFNEGRLINCAWFGDRSDVSPSSIVLVLVLVVVLVLDLYAPWYELSDWREEGERSQSSDSPWHKHPVEHENDDEHEND